MNAAAWVPLCLITVAMVGFYGHARWSRATTSTLRCDELPLLTRFTSLCGNAACESEAQSYRPSLFYLRTGAVRSLRVLRGVFAVHTTTGFWTNLSLNVLGYGPLGVRAGPLFWSFACLAVTGRRGWLRGIPRACARRFWSLPFRRFRSVTPPRLAGTPRRWR